MTDFTAQVFSVPFSRVASKLWPHWSSVLFAPIFIALFVPQWLGAQSLAQNTFIIAGVVVGVVALLYLLVRASRVQLVIDTTNGALNVRNPVRSYRVASSDIARLSTGDIRVATGGRNSVRVNDYRCLAIDSKKSNFLTPSPIRVIASIDNDAYMAMSSAAQKFAVQYSIPQSIDIQAD